MGVPPLLLSPPSEDSMPELAGMSPTPPVLSMLPRGRLRLIPMSSDTTDWDMEVMPDMEAMPVWDTLVWDTPVWDMLPMDTLLLSLLSMLPPLWLLPPLLFMLLPPSLLPITATPRFPPLLPSPPLVPPLLLSPPSEDSMPELDGMSPTPPVLFMSHKR